MEAVSDTARLPPLSERSNRDMRVAHRVTEQMRSMSSGLQGQLFDSEHELHFGGVKQLTRVWRAAYAVVSVAERVHE